MHCYLRKSLPQTAILVFVFGVLRKVAPDAKAAEDERRRVREALGVGWGGKVLVLPFKGKIPRKSSIRLSKLFVDVFLGNHLGVSPSGICDQNYSKNLPYGSDKVWLELVFFFSKYTCGRMSNGHKLFANFPQALTPFC